MYRTSLSTLLGALALILPSCSDVVPEHATGPTCALAEGDPLREAVETRCDGVDNDCDGVTDQLMPQAQNACSTGAKGVCGQGFAACVDGARACLVSPAHAESHNGLDDDCNGATDDVQPAPKHAQRLHILVPPYLWKEQPHVTTGLIDVLQAAGVPFDAVAADDPDRDLDWANTFFHLQDYDVLYLPGYVGGWALPDDKRAQLEQWVQAGGVLVLVKPLGLDPSVPAVDQDQTTALLTLAGLKDGTPHKDVLRVAVTPDAPAALPLDSAEERDLIVNVATTTPQDAVEVFTYTPDTSAGTQGFAQARTATGNAGTTWLRRPLGQGAVYTLGFDPLEYVPQRFNINGFDPALDVGVVLFRAFAAEAGHGHAVVKHTVPGVESSVLLLTHDVDAPDAHHASPEWGDAGAVQMATMEKSLGVQGTYFVTTDYVIGYWNPDLPGQLCALDMCPDGGHSVQHQDMNVMPEGTCANVTQANYTPTQPTMCAEILVNLQILRKGLSVGQEIRAWRSPYLSPHPLQPQVLTQQGIAYDSSYSTGDWRSAFPGSTARHLFVDDKLWKDKPLWSFPIAHEDGIARKLDGKEVREELQKKNRPEFLARWKYAFLQHVRQGAWNVVLVHPSYGVGPGVGPANLKEKIDTLREFTQFALQHDVRSERIAALGDFWRGRDGVDLHVTWDDKLGYQGTLVVGAVAAPRFSLAFTDDLAQFDAPGAGPVTVKGGRVVFEQPLQPGQTYAFTAMPKK